MRDNQQRQFRELPKDTSSVNQVLSVFKHFRKFPNKKKESIWNSNDWCWWQTSSDYYYDPTTLVCSGEEKCNLSSSYLLGLSKQGNHSLHISLHNT